MAQQQQPAYENSKKKLKKKFIFNLMCKFVDFVILNLYNFKRNQSYMYITYIKQTKNHNLKKDL